MKSWIEEEVRGCALPDVRLKARFGRLLDSLSDGMGRSLPMACQDWAATKAAYRFLDNDRVDESAILSGHFKATRSRFVNSPGIVLVLHDTTELSYAREHVEEIGKIHKSFVGRTKEGRPQVRTVCGLLVHSSLVVTTTGVPLGLAAAKFWTRKKFRGTNALKRKVNPTRVPIERKESIRWIENVRQSTDLLGDPARCVHIGDRESDIYELFCTAHEAGTHFLVRTCVDRLAEDGSVTIWEEMEEEPSRGVHRIQVRDRDGQVSEADLQIRFRRLRVLPPIGKQKRYPSLSLTVIHAVEKDAPTGRERIDWKLLTDLPVASLDDAIRMLTWYAMRWKIETFHKILKSGCKAEELKLRTAERLVNLIAIFCILGWRVFWLCMVNRAEPAASPSVVFTDVELQILDRVVKEPQFPATRPVSSYLTRVARLGGYLARANDSPPGNAVIWRGFSRLTDIHLGFVLGAKLVGN